MSTHKPSTLLRTLILLSVIFANLGLPVGSAVPRLRGRRCSLMDEQPVCDVWRYQNWLLVHSLALLYLHGIQRLIPNWVASSLTFNGSTAYVTTGTGTAFNSATFTVETWFYRTAAGVGVTTGGSGIASAIPLLTKGTSEDETANADINYFLGIDATSAKLVADFEEGAGGASPSLNHPITGTTTIALNTWYHAAATYDGNKWQLFLNGNLEGELVVGRPANAAVVSPLAIATSIQSNGTTIQGYFAGRMDEARIWNYARTQAEIQASMNSEILVPTMGCWAAGV